MSKKKSMTPKAARRVTKVENDKTGHIPKDSFAKRAVKAANKNKP